MTSNLSGEELNILSGIESELAFTLDTYNRDIILELGKIAVGAMESEIYNSFDKDVSFKLKDIGITKIDKIKDSINENVILTKYDIGIDEKISYMMLTSNDEEEFFKVFKVDNAIDKYESLKQCWSEVISSAIETSYILLALEDDVPELKSELLLKNEVEIEPVDKEKDELVCVSYDLTLNQEKLNINFSILLTIEAATFLTSKMGSVKDGDDFPEEVLREISYDHEEDDDEILEDNKEEEAYGIAQFPDLVKSKGKKHDNINLILDVPLEISAVLGRSKKTIRDILEFTNGSLIELNKLAEEPIEILVNGKKIALGEVVVLDENFGVRITDIVSNIDRVKSLK